MNVHSKVALITGASSGIGRALAWELVRRGAMVGLMARNRKALDDLAEELSLAGIEAPGAIKDNRKPKAAVALPADVADRAAVEHAVGACLTHFGSIDVLVNCAGVGYFGPVESMPMAGFDALVKTNLYGVVNVTQAALPALKKSRGIIVNISSGLAMRAIPYLSAYAGTKSMLNALSDGMRLELAPYGIRVLTYCPPHTDSGFDERSLKGTGMEKVAMSGGGHTRTETVAAGIAEAIHLEKRRTGGRAFLIMNALAPGLMDRMFRKMALTLGKRAGMFDGAQS